MKKPDVIKQVAESSGLTQGQVNLAIKALVKVIQDNLNTSIKSINGKDPFTFIQEFVGINLRNKHSTYVFKQIVYTKNNLNIPVSMEDLTNFTIVYSNGDNFTTDYIIQDISQTSDNFMFYENDEDNKKFVSYLKNQNNKLNSLLLEEHKSLFAPLPFMNLDDIILEFEKNYKVKTNTLFNLLIYFLHQKKSRTIIMK